MPEQVLPGTDRGFAFGDALFETVRVEDDGARSLRRHVARFTRSANALCFEADQIARACGALEGLATAAPGLWRVTVSRADRDCPFGGTGDVFVTHRALAKATPPRVVSLAGWYQPNDRFAEHKTSSWIRSVHARRYARERGADDVVMCSVDGLVGEASAANLFAVIDGVLVTPELRGILGGTTRARLLDAALESDMPCEIRALSIDELRGASELYLTSVAVGVLPVASLDGQALRDTWRDELGRLLSETT